MEEKPVMKSMETAAERKTGAEGMSVEQIIEIEVERLKDFRDHPFSVVDDDEMKDLIKSNDGKVLIEKDTLIEQKTTDADGQILPEKSVQVLLCRVKIQKQVEK